MRVTLILFCLSIGRFAYSQSTAPLFAVFNNDEIHLTECDFDKNAGAVVLLDWAESDYDDNYRLITHRRKRIKIFHQREADRGNITIPFYSKDAFEYIENIRGVTCNIENGQIALTYLDNKSIFIEKDIIYSNMRFAMPNVKPGSIIEYEYDSYMKHYGGLPDWIFQNEIPTVKSSYMLAIVPNAEFQYNVQKKRDYPIIIKPFPDAGKIYFEMNNIPGLKFEPYMDAVRDYLQKVEFQLSGYANRHGDLTKFSQTWKDAAYELLSNKEFGGAIRKNLSIPNDLKLAMTIQTNDSGRVATIYNFVRKNFTCTRNYGPYAFDGIKKAWDNHSGPAGEINMILVNLLQSFDLEAYPLLVAERDYGKIDTTYPFLDRFNKVVAYAKADGKTFILDATQTYTPPGLTPYPLLNTIAFIVDKKNFNLIRILSSRNSYSNSITVTGKIDNAGLLTGTAEIASSGYAKQLRTEKIKRDNKKFISETLQEPGGEILVDNLVSENLDDDNKPLIQKIDFHNEMNASGGFIFLTGNLFTGFSKSPFTSETRFTNINFGYPYNIHVEAKIELPGKAKIDKLPESRHQVFGAEFVIVDRQFKLENNTLFISVNFRQTMTLIPNEQYSSLKAIYKQAIDLLNEPVLVKIVN
ncbi:MAG: DUF3857 domain-containing protein [Bacteroidetes bacterium]|nr:MAG: DUF3857 domain-containing protein [Bacteroidota bacterium]